MKTITFNTSNLSAYIFEDGDVVTVSAENITCPNFIIGDLNSSNCTLHTDVATVPADWTGHKYTYNGTAWTANPDYVLSLIHI